MVLVEPDPTVYTAVGSDDTTAEEIDGALRWTIDEVGPDGTEELTYTATADAKFSAAARTAVNGLTVAVNGVVDPPAGTDAPVGVSDPLPVAGDPAALTVLHAALDGSTVVTRNGTVDYQITVTNGSASPIVDIVVRVEPDASGVFASFEPLDGGTLTDGRPTWTVRRLNSSDSITLGYRATAAASLDEEVGDVVNDAVVDVLGDERRYPAVALDVGLPVDAIDIEHRASVDVTLNAGEQVEYIITVVNRSQEPIEDLTLGLEVDERVFDVHPRPSIPPALSTPRSTSGRSRRCRGHPRSSPSPTPSPRRTTCPRSTTRWSTRRRSRKAIRRSGSRRATGSRWPEPASRMRRRP